MKVNHSMIVDARRFKDNSLILSRQSKTTLMGSNLLNYQGRFYGDQLSEWFLLNYRQNNNSPDFANSVGIYSGPGAVASMRTQNWEECDNDAIELPKAKALKGSLTTCLEGRHSVRTYVDTDGSLQDFSTLLYHALAVKGLGVSDRIFPRSYPSGGGLYPLYLYFYVHRIKGLKSGYYRYQPFHHRLRFVGDRHVELDSLVNLKGIDVENFTAMGFYVYERRRNVMKYGDLGVTLALIEAGQMMQTLNLVGYLLGYGFCELGGYFKKIIEREIEVDGLDTHVVGCFVMGAEF